MRMKHALIWAMCFGICAICQKSLAMPPNDLCALPPELSKEISRRYPATSLVSLLNLDEYDRKLFQKDHETQCPGLVKVDFYGDGMPTWVLVLISGNGSKSKADLVVAHQMGKNWETNTLDSAPASVPVVWSEGPGKYNDVYGEKTIRATHPVVFFVGYGGWAIVYAWTGKRIEKVWVRD